MYEVSVGRCGNPDHGEFPWIGKQKLIKASSLHECALIVRSYIEANALGSGNWNGGNVYYNGDFVGVISYNGRFWPKYHKYGKEVR